MSGSTASTSLSPARVASLLLPPLAVMAFIFFLSSQQSDGDHTTFVLLLRKLAHVTEYTVLTLCWWRALRGLGIGRDVRTTLAIAATIALQELSRLTNSLESLAYAALGREGPRVRRRA